MYALSSGRIQNIFSFFRCDVCSLCVCMFVNVCIPELDLIRMYFSFCFVFRFESKSDWTKQNNDDDDEKSSFCLVTTHTHTHTNKHAKRLSQKWLSILIQQYSSLWLYVKRKKIILNSVNDQKKKKESRNVYSGEKEKPICINSKIVLICLGNFLENKN